MPDRRLYSSRINPTMIMKKLLLSLLGTTLAIAATAQTPAAPAAAGATAPAATPKPKPLSPTDKKFIMDVSDGLLTEQKYLMLLTDAKIGSYSEGMQRDIKRANGDLKRIWTALATLATAKGAEVAQEVSKAELTKIDKLTKEKPDKFDKEFFKDFGKITAKTVKLFEGAKSLQDPEVRQFAADWGTIVTSQDLLATTGEKMAAKKK